MNFKQQMIDQIIARIKSRMRTGDTREEAIDRVKSQSLAGPAVWIEVLKLI